MCISICIDIYLPLPIYVYIYNWKITKVTSITEAIRAGLMGRAASIQLVCIYNLFDKRSH